MELEQTQYNHLLMTAQKRLQCKKVQLVALLYRYHSFTKKGRTYEKDLFQNLFTENSKQFS